MIIIANWKANPKTVKEATALARNIERSMRAGKNTEVVVAPPYPFLSAIGMVLKKTKLGAQNSFWEDTGPYTGEVSWRHLKNLGVRYVIIGHSERKKYSGETDIMINKKVRVLLENGITPILCIGENKKRKTGISSEIARNLRTALLGVPAKHLSRLIIAYEPVWAISTNPGSRPDTPDNASRVSRFMRSVLSRMYGRAAIRNLRIIYGGSVHSRNIRSYLDEGMMQGALVGKASLNAQEFLEIVRRAHG